MSQTTIFADSFDTLDTASVGLNWSYISGNVTPVIVSGLAGATNNCVRLAPGLVNNGPFRTNLPVTESRMVAGMRERVYSLPEVGYWPICSFWDGPATTDVTLYGDAAGQLSVWRNGRTVQVGGFSDPGLIHFLTWGHIGFDLSWGTGGSNGFTVYVNSLPVLTFTGATAPNDSGISMFSLWGGPPNNSGSAYQWFDDVYVSSSGFYGDLQGLANLPSGAGDLTEWVIGGSSPAPTNYQSVNSVPPANSVKFVSADTVGLTDLYTYPALPADVIQIVFVQQPIDAKTDISGLAGGARIAPVLSNGGTPEEGAEQTLNTEFQYRTVYWDTNPMTGLPWEVAEWGSLQGGQRRTA